MALGPVNPSGLQLFDMSRALARAGLDAQGRPLAGLGATGNSPATAPTATTASSFGHVLSQALQAVSQDQLQATDMQRQVQLGNPEVSLEATMVAMQKAQVGFAALVQTRNRLVQAYTDIMNMNV